MKKIQNLNIGMMGVVNATPDSFSDGGLANNKETFRNRLEVLRNCDIIDIGAESTAPFNKAITFKVECNRLESIVDFSALESFSRISIDTYHPETVEYFLAHYKGTGEVIWNDVSGVFDEPTARLLKKFPKLSYIYAYTHVPEKSLTSDHMKFIEKELYPDKKFKNFLLEMESYANKVYLDPCFGFSKSREQNHALIKDLPRLIKQFNFSWLVGISRKSFLRFSDLPKDHPQLLFETEVLQSIIINKWIQDLMELDRTIMFRIHDPIVYNSIGHFYNSINGTRKN